MAIKAQCGSCGTSFSAKDEFAGKRVKCPKCSQPMTIEQRSLVAGTRPTTVSLAGAAGHNPLLDLLDEAGVESVPQGPICENCGADMELNAVICVGCGFNMSTGLQLETESFEDPAEAQSDEEISDADRIMAKAEREIEEMPVTAVGQNFGDGADSFLIAFVGMIGLLILVTIGVGIIFLMDFLGDSIDPALISFYASIGIYVLCTIWITIIAFMAKPVQGIICVCTGGLYCIIFGFLTRGLILPAIILCTTVVIGLVSCVFAFAPKDDFGMQIQSIQSFLGQFIALSV
ncbi:MAG: hypothetical protein P8K79_06435 [Mariniblastus sp.]|nr:hypothetical protein [Mariniblastus sp.]